MNSEIAKLRYDLESERRCSESLRIEMNKFKKKLLDTELELRQYEVYKRGIQDELLKIDGLTGSDKEKIRLLARRAAWNKLV